MTGPTAHAPAGPVALVAGGTGPIGRAVATALAARGFRVAVHYRSRPDTAQALVAGLPAPPPASPGASAPPTSLPTPPPPSAPEPADASLMTRPSTAQPSAAPLAGDSPETGRSVTVQPVQPVHLAVGADLTAPGAVEALVATVEEALGPVAVLVNAAHPGLSAPVPMADPDPGALAGQLAAVAAHAALCARVVPGMRKAGNGRVVYLSGALMARPAPGFGYYGAAKAAATTLTRYLALEEGTHGITANIVAPGRVVDPGEPEDLTPEQADLSERLLQRMALGVFPSPADIARAVVTLVESPAVTGQTLWLTGGEPIGV
ncbi:SDR family NAD(P)-dependent oxidoreductase [Kineosporia succinea]|uniref:NAD(P)-dependent dehydrogenase (Short-subunit alcohol dehydrogenase family) n=1 Tax=Kineosporia succinea TaxID=84632 RepID=A0ABT9PBL1_9ACTN|nr:SDR family oxidoreductase [Kineosporia succinea]MDP9829784.1 NAD(P)-dependent dehydrogenase (short-subunit alcohol dehydrogenase family) [Kineosporia succinea]